MEPAAKAPHILLVDDDPEQLEATRLLLESEGYRVSSAASGPDALGKMSRTPPELVVSDVVLPGFTGLELIAKMSEDPFLRNIPVILVSGKRITPEDRLAGMNLGGDEYLVKPFDPEELFIRVKAVLRRVQIGLDANPMTKLPGNSSILREIEQLLAQKSKFAILYADLNNFKAFNDRYGFLKGDDVIRFTAGVILRAVNKTSSCDFVGHIGGDDFVVITVPERADALCQTIIREFDEGIVQFYAAKDVSRRGLEVKDRLGNKIFHPLMGIAIGVVSNAQRVIKSVGEVSEIGAEMKKHVKSMGGSCYAADRRKNDRRTTSRPANATKLQNT